jgi:hypothetical protein
MAAKNKAKNGATGKKHKRFAELKRAWNGIIVTCFIITAVACTLAGASMITMLYRTTTVCIILLAAGRIIISSWASWEDLKKAGHGKHR